MRVNWIHLLTLIISVSEARLFEYKGDETSTSSTGSNSIDEEDQTHQQSDYSITDIVKRHRLLTETTRHEVEIFKNPKYDTSCIKKALTPILPKCLKSNIDSLDPELRAITAAKLSICEFEVAKITYPNECYPRRYFFSSDEDSIDYEDCILSLEKSPQWWTTYSGNYRAIGDICFQESLPYEKDEILNLFLNVTEIYEKILEDLNESIEMSTNFKQSSKKSFEELKKFMDQVLSKFQQDSDEEKSAYGEKLKEMNKILEETSSLTKLLSNNTIDVTGLVINQIQELGTKWDGFFNEFDNDEFMNGLKLMKETFIKDIEERNFKTNQLLDDISNKLTTTSSIFDNNLEKSQKLELSLDESLQNSQTIDKILRNTGDSIMISSDYATNLLETFTELDKLNIGEILNVSEQELLLVFQRITNQLNKEMDKVHVNAKILDDELITLVDRIGEATGSLITINDILSNNLVMKVIIFFASKANFLMNRAMIVVISLIVYYYLLVFKFQLIGKNFKILVILFFTSIGGLIMGTMVIRLMNVIINSKSNSMAIPTL